MKTVTVVIPTYKGSKVIKRCIESVLKQSYKLLNIVIVDDNGVESEEQVKTYTEIKEYLHYPNVKYIAHSKNINGSAARNTGTKNSKSDYICYFDDDDCLNKNAIEYLVSRLESSDEKVALAYCSCTTITISSGREKVRKVEKSGDILFDYLMDQTFLCSSNTLFKRSVIEELGGWDETFVRHQDLEMITRVLSKYEAVSVDYIGVVKFQEERNNPRNAETLEKQGEYFLQNRSSYIDSLGKEKHAKVIAHYKTNWAKWYLYELKFKEFFRLAKESQNPALTLFLAIRFAIVRWLKV